MISLDKIKTTIALYSSQSVSLEIDLASEKFRLDQLKLDIDYAKSWNIGFLQAGYDTKGGGTLGSQMDYRVGITIPLFNEDKPKLRREELNLLGVEGELKRLEKVNALIDRKRMKDFYDLIFRHKMLKQKEQELSNLANEGVNGIEGFLALSKYLSLIHI